MIDAPTTSPATPSFPAQPSASRPGGGPAAHLPAPTFGPGVGLRDWLTRRRNDGATPAVIARELVAAGWDADRAATAAMSSLRSADRRGLLYATLTFAAGLAALSVGSAVHLLLGGNHDPAASAAALTFTAVFTPVAIWAALVAARAERASEFVVWSPDRRFWFGALAGCTAAIGMLRAVTYLYAFFVGVTGAAAPPTAADFAQVAISLGISVPLFIWSAQQWRRSNVVRSALSTGS